MFYNNNDSAWMQRPPASSHDQAAVLGLSPIEQRRKGSLMQEYQRKVDHMMHNSNLTFEKIETPGWSSLVESNISDNKKQTAKHEDILKKLISLNTKTYEEVENSGKAHIQRPRSTTTLQRLPKFIRKQPVQVKKNQSNSQLKKSNSRWREISIHQHLYLDSKKQETKRMVEKIMDQEMRNQIFKFHPTINPNSVVLAEQRYKKLQADPYYRCSVKPRLKPQVKKEKIDVTEIEFKCLHALFYIMSNGILALQKENLNIEQVPLPCLRSLELLLEDIYAGRTLSWIEFLQGFYSKAQNKKAFFSVLTEWMKRNQIDLDI